ncbi:MAG TPA: glycosyltransferase family 4 protein, partial [Candidatus Acidoferrum sp.]|nr:glycosyltransferase family 4 protein [Candidatus Acidoferrum sp.]
GLPSDAIVAVTAARLVEQKGHCFMMEAMPEILSKFPHFYWLLLGSGPLETELRSQAEGLGVSTHVIFAGMLDSLAEVLAGADLMVHPSIDEPFGIALVEGMRAGLPIVASRVGGIPEVIGECAILVEPSRSDDLAKEIRAMLESKADMVRIGEACRKRYESEFTCDRMIDCIEQYLTNVMRAVPRG